MEQTQDYSEPNRNYYLILGGGYFGLKAAQKILLNRIQKNQSNGKLKSPLSEKSYRIWIIDKRIDCLSFSELKKEKKENLHFIIAEAGDFLDAFLSLSWVIKNAHHMMIVPAVPFHLAAEWLIKSLVKERRVNRVNIERIPLETAWNLPFEYMDPLGNRYLSMATWRCSENCLPSPGRCSLTNIARPVDLFTFIEKQVGRSEVFQEAIIRVIKSEQLAPGLGAYPCHELIALKEEALNQAPGKKFLIATACTCHGVVTQFQINSH